MIVASVPARISARELLHACFTYIEYAYTRFFPTRSSPRHSRVARASLTEHYGRIAVLHFTQHSMRTHIAGSIEWCTIWQAKAQLPPTFSATTVLNSFATMCAGAVLRNETFCVTLKRSRSAQPESTSAPNADYRHPCEYLNISHASHPSIGVCVVLVVWMAVQDDVLEYEGTELNWAAKRE